MSSEIEVNDPKLGTCLADRYRLDEPLAAGGMGVVYRGVDVKRDRPIAVKFVHEVFAALPTLVKRFQREVAAMQRLSHKNLVGIVDSGVSSGVPYLVMDFHAGRSLAELLERGALTGPRAISITRQILAGVGHAHASGVVHRDLKPDNILIVGDDEVKILDFGLAKIVSEEGTGTQLTNTGFALGTPGYMSPEQARGGATDERSDIYAVGVILYQAVTGRRPFVAESPMAVLRMHMDEPPLPPRRTSPDCKISGALEAAILRALEKDPARRWQSTTEMTRALDATPEARGEPIPDDEPQLTIEGYRQAVPIRRRSSRPIKIAIALLLLAGAGLGWSQLSRRKQKDLQQSVQTAMKRTVDGPVKDAVEGASSLVKDAWHGVTQPEAPVQPETAAHPETAGEEDDDSEPPPSHDTPGAQLEARSEPAAPSKRAPTVEEAARLLQAGNLDAAIQTLYRVRAQTPRLAVVPLLLGHAYFRKLWRSDGLREYNTALSLRPAYKRDKQLLRNVVAALDDPTSRAARATLKKRLRAFALPELQHAAHDGKNPTVQKRALRLLAELRRRR